MCLQTGVYDSPWAPNLPPANPDINAPVGRYVDVGQPVVQVFINQVMVRVAVQHAHPACVWRSLAGPAHPLLAHGGCGGLLWLVAETLGTLSRRGAVPAAGRLFQ